LNFGLAESLFGRIMFEVDGVDINDAKKAMTLAAAKLPIKCKFVERNI
jgi:Ribosomal protein L16/L10E